jgi:hypothetical protein
LGLPNRRSRAACRLARAFFHGNWIFAVRANRRTLCQPCATFYAEHNNLPQEINLYLAPIIKPCAANVESQAVTNSSGPRYLLSTLGKIILSPSTTAIADGSTSLAFAIWTSSGFFEIGDQPGAVSGNALRENDLFTIGRESK